MSASITFDRSLIAPCGMNCGTCIGFLREKNKCSGCLVNSDSKPKHCVACSIKNCTELEKTTSGLCYECLVFPCKRLKQLNKRYETRYKTSLISNLLRIKENGISDFLDFETKRRTCPQCGSILSVHRDSCMNCVK